MYDFHLCNPIKTDFAKLYRGDLVTISFPYEVDLIPIAKATKELTLIDLTETLELPKSSAMIYGSQASLEVFVGMAKIAMQKANSLSADVIHTTNRHLGALNEQLLSIRAGNAMEFSIDTLLVEQILQNEALTAGQRVDMTRLWLCCGSDFDPTDLSTPRMALSNGVNEIPTDEMLRNVVYFFLDIYAGVLRRHRNL